MKCHMNKFKDKCDICYKFDYLISYHNKCICNECLTNKQKSMKNKKIKAIQLSLDKYIKG